MQKRRQERGRPTPVVVEGDSETIVSETAVAWLCADYLSSQLDESEISYIADALLLANFSHSVRFTSQLVTDILSELTDPEVNGSINREKVMSVLMRLPSRPEAQYHLIHLRAGLTG